MARIDKYRKIVDESPALNATSPVTKFHVNWHYGY